MNLYNELVTRNTVYADRPSLCQMRKDGTLRTITYREMFTEIDRYYELLKSTGNYKPGDRIGICAAACPEWEIVLFAISKLECTAVCIDHSYQSEEMQSIVRKAKLQGLFLNDDTYKMLDDPIDGINTYNIHTCEAINLHPRNEDYPRIEEAAVLIFSSGTTSTAAGILHAADSLVIPVDNILHANYVNTDHEKFMAFLPNSHIYGFCGQLIAHILYGCSVCYLEEMSASCILGAFDKFHPTIFLGVPKVYELLMHNISGKIESSRLLKLFFNILFPVCLKIRQKTGLNPGKYIFSSIKKGLGGNADVMLNGGAPVLKETAEFFYGVGLRPLNTYGATETSVPTLGNFGKNITMNTCGRAYPGIKTRISSEGELQFYSEYKMLGYFEEPERTANAYTEDGWFKSGDLASLDENGNILIQGRLKENIVLATGKKVAPDDIETNYQGIPGVSDFTVSGIPAGEDGSYDEVHCFVVPEAAADTDSIVEAFLAKSAASPLTMKLHGVHVLDKIPRTAIGKPKRFQLVEMMQSEGGLENAQNSHEKAAGDMSIEEKVHYAVSKITGADEFTEDSRLFDDLALDSLSAIELCVELEALTGVRVDDYTGKHSSVGDLVELCTNPPEDAINKKKKQLEYPLKHKAIDWPVMKICYFILGLMHRVTITGTENIPTDSGYIICPNHVSNFDYLYVTRNFTKNHYKTLAVMGKKELSNGSFLATQLCRISGMVPIDRGGTVSDSMKNLGNKLAEGWSILAFPEGTRSTDGKLGEFKHGASSLAIKYHVPVIPVYIKGGYEVYSRHSKIPKIFDHKKMGRHVVDVKYGMPIYPAETDSNEMLTERLRTAIEKLADE